jgi:hypothetical protein
LLIASGNNKRYFLRSDLCYSNIIMQVFLYSDYMIILRTKSMGFTDIEVQDE